MKWVSSVGAKAALMAVAGQGRTACVSSSNAACIQGFRAGGGGGCCSLELYQVCSLQHMLPSLRIRPYVAKLMERQQGWSFFLL